MFYLTSCGISQANDTGAIIFVLLIKKLLLNSNSMNIYTKNSLFILFMGSFLLVLQACQPAKPQAETTKIEPVKTEDVLQVSGIGRVEPENKIIKLNSEVGGLITAIKAKEGDKVSAGQVIVELSHGIEDSRVGQAESRIPTQKAAVQDAEAAVATFAARIESARMRLQSVKVREAASKVRLDRIKLLVAKDADTKQNLDAAQADYDALQQDVRTAQAEIDAAMRDRDRAETSIKTAKSRIGELEADVKVASSQRAQRSIRAPYSGTILSLEATLGSNLAPGTSIGEFAPAGAITTVCEIDELFAARVQVGQKAFIRNQGMADTLSTGTVIFAAPYLKKKSLFSADAGELEDRRVREVRIKLDKPEKVLIGARVDCVILFR